MFTTALPPAPTRRAVLALSLAGLAGCTATPIVIDRAAMADVQRVGVPTVGFPEKPEVEVLNATSRHFGLVGLLAGSIVRSNRVDAAKALLAAHRFDPRAHFEAALAERLKARHLTLVAEAADPDRHDFLKMYGDDQRRDAVLDLWVAQYGFVALSDSDSAPYRPTVSVRARLVAARDRSVLMQDSVLVSGIEADSISRDGAILGSANFKTFTEIEANPERAVASLAAALSAAAGGVVKRLG